MTAFRFRLERLLRVRTIEEELAREAWIEAREKARAAELDAEQRRAEADGALAELRRRQAEPAIAPSRILAEHLHLQALRRAHSRAELHARALAAEAARLAIVWRERDAAKRGLERLEEKARTAHRSEREVLEARTLDEVASMRAARVARESARTGLGS